MRTHTSFWLDTEGVPIRLILKVLERFPEAKFTERIRIAVPGTFSVVPFPVSPEESAARDLLRKGAELGVTFSDADRQRLEGLAASAEEKWAKNRQHSEAEATWFDSTQEELNDMILNNKPYRRKDQELLDLDDGDWPLEEDEEK